MYLNHASLLEGLEAERLAGEQAFEQNDTYWLEMSVQEGQQRRRYGKDKFTSSLNGVLGVSSSYIIHRERMQVLSRSVLVVVVSERRRGTPQSTIQSSLVCVWNGIRLSVGIYHLPHILLLRLRVSPHQAAITLSKNRRCKGFGRIYTLVTIIPH